MCVPALVNNRKVGVVWVELVGDVDDVIVVVACVEEEEVDGDKAEDKDGVDVDDRIEEDES